MAHRAWAEVTAAQDAVLRTLLERLPAEWTPIERVADLLAETLDALQDVTARDAGLPDWTTDPAALLAKLWSDGSIEVRARRQRYSSTHELLDAGRDDRRATRFTADGLVTSGRAGFDPEHRLDRRITRRHPHGDPEPVVTLGYDAEIRRSPAPAPQRPRRKPAELNKADLTKNADNAIARKLIDDGLLNLDPTPGEPSIHKQCEELGSHIPGKAGAIRKRDRLRAAVGRVAGR